MPDVRGLEKGTTKEISATDRGQLFKDLDADVSAHKEPLTAELIDKNKGNIQALIETVNDNSKQGYGGMSADGSELTKLFLTVQDFDKGKWQGSISSGVQTWFAEATLGEEEGLIIFGFANKVACGGVTDSVKVYKGTEQSTVVPLPFLAEQACCKDETCTYQGGSMETPIVELPDPILIPPETSFKIESKAPISGCDALQPLGYHIVPAEYGWELDAWPTIGSLPT